MSLDDDDEQVEFIEPDCVVGELVTSFVNDPPKRPHLAISCFIKCQILKN